MSSVVFDAVFDPGLNIYHVVSVSGVTGQLARPPFGRRERASQGCRMRYLQASRSAYRQRATYDAQPRLFGG